MPSASIPGIPSIPTFGGSGVRRGYPLVALSAISGVRSEWNPLLIATLFQNVAGSTPVAANGDPIGNITAGATPWVAVADDGTRPTYAAAGIRGYPAIQFAGASLQKLINNALSAFLTGIDTPYSLAVAVQVTTPNANQGIFTAGRAASANPFVIERAGSTALWTSLKRDNANASESIAPASPLITAGVPVVFGVQCDGTTHSTWINGVKVNGPTSLNVGDTTLDRVTMGALGLNTYSQFLTGFIGHGAFYDNAISDLNMLGAHLTLRDEYQI